MFSGHCRLLGHIIVVSSRYTISHKLQSATILQRPTTIAALAFHSSPRTFTVKVPLDVSMEPRAPAGVFPSRGDRFRGITVDTDHTKIDPEQFPEQLQKSLDWWLQNERRAIWFRINTKSAAIVPILAQHGFDFHHARDGFVMMVRWIHRTETVNIPPYAHHMVGVGGLVINARDQILSVSERFSPVQGSWKLPGGYVEPGENLVEAGIREVFEETGIRTRFESMVSVRHAHGTNFDCSDLYVVMVLRTLDSAVAGDGGGVDGPAATADTIRTCEREIADAKWMEFDEYLTHPRVHELNRDLLRQYLRNRAAGVRISRTEGEHPLLRRKYNVYAVDEVNAKL